MDESFCTPERRVAERVDVERPITITAGTAIRQARTVNVSASGMLVAADGDLAIWAEVAVALPGLAIRGGRIVRRDGERYGLVFREPLSGSDFTHLTGVELVQEAPVERSAEPVARVQPWAFGRDKMKGFQREAAERARALR
jgi:hypothetical protein